MKILKCQPGHSIHIKLKDSVDPATPVDYVFGHSEIDIYIGYSTGKEVRVAVQVPQYFNVVHYKELG